MKTLISPSIRALRRRAVTQRSHYREASYALLRVTLGVVLLTTGISKLMMGIDNFAAGLQQEFAGQLPTAIVTPFAYMLPFIEITVGTLLILGLMNVIALFMAGLLLMVLTFGKTAVNDSATVAGNLSYVLINFVLLWLADYNGYSIDRMRHRRASVDRP